MAPLLQFENLSLKNGGTTLLEHVHLAIAEGTFVFIVGQSGAGKSLVLKLMNGLIEPTSGIIRYKGEIVKTGSENTWYKIRQQTGYVFQQAALFDSLTLKENILLKSHYFDEKNISELLSELKLLLPLVGLSETHLDLYPSELSEGMKKRAALIRATLHKPKLLLLDEPAAGLDPEFSNLVDDFTVHYHQKNQATVVAVSHHPASIKKLATHLLLIENKTVAFCEPYSSVRHFVKKYPFLNYFI